MFEKMCDWNTENPMVRDGLWDNSERYDDPDESTLPFGYHELGWRIYLDALSRDQKDAFFQRLKAQAQKCEFDVFVKRWKDYVVIDGVVSDDEEELLGEICDEYEDVGLKSCEVW